MPLILSGSTPKLKIKIVTLSTGALVSGLAGGACYFINPAGAAVLATNTLVEVDATHAKGEYTVLVSASDGLSSGEWLLSYQTPATFLNQGRTEFTVNAPAGFVITSGTCSDVSSSATLRLDDTVATPTKDFLVGGIAVIVGGTGLGQMRSIIGYQTGLPNKVTVNPAWDANLGGLVPDATSQYVILAGTSGIAGTVNDPVNSVPVQSQLKRAAALDNFPFLLLDSAGAAVTGATVTTRISKDGGALADGGTTATVAEVGSGWYTVDFSGANLDCKTLAFQAAAAGALTVRTVLITDP